MLATIERRRVNHEHRVHESAIGRVGAVLGVKVERVHGRLLASGLNDASRPQIFAPGEVVLQSDAVPVIEFHGRKKGIVITMPQTRSHGDVAPDLSCTGHRAGSKVKSRRSTSSIQVSPQGPRGLVLEVAEFISDNSGSTIPDSAVASVGQRRLKERLWGEATQS